MKYKILLFILISSPILSNINRDLMSNEEFTKPWFNIQFGIASSYKISSKVSDFSSNSIKLELF